MKMIRNILLLTLIASCVQAQKYAEKISFEAASASTILIENVFGDVIVEGYDGSTVLVSGQLNLSSETSEDLAKGKSEFSVASRSRNDSLLIYNKAPFIKTSFDPQIRGTWCNAEDIGYNFKVDLKVKVPYGSNLKVGTVNDGLVTIKSVTGVIKASNVNGSVELEGVTTVSRASTVNGNIDITYKEVPKGGGKFNTVNGNVTINSPKGLSGTIDFKAMHGDLFTEFEYESVGPAVKRTEKTGDSGSRFKIESTTRIKIGSGQHQMSFETINGNMYLKQI